jgi:chromosomal replication initiation ATPase DnaA
MLQKTFNFIHEPEYYEQDYIISYCNLEAYKALQHPEKWPFGRLLILGEAGSGKTHLCNIWQGTSSAISLEESTALNVLNNHINSKNFILENIENIQEEENLFHIINFCMNNSCKLLLTANILPHYMLPDLRSRINASYKILIKKPEDDL